MRKITKGLNPDCCIRSVASSSTRVHYVPSDLSFRYWSFSKLLGPRKLSGQLFYFVGLFGLLTSEIGWTGYHVLFMVVMVGSLNCLFLLLYVVRLVKVLDCFV